jgi:hypothetical protein
MKSSEEIKKAINEVAKLLGTEEFNIMVTKTQFPTSGKPMSAWSMTNKLMCILAYSKINNVSLNQAILDIQKMDFRGNKQWEKIERKVTNKQKSATILIPIRFNYYKKGEKTISAKEYEKLENKEDWRNINYKGFKGLDVYEKQQTDGKPVEYPKLNLPKYDYEEVAKFLGLKIIAEHGGSSYNGYYSQQAKAIVLATPEEGTFYHELAHAVDDYLLKQKGKKLVGGQDVDQEVIAQTTSGILAYINGQRIKENLGYTRKYVEGYAGKDFEKTILKVMGRIERILTFILNFKDKTSGVQQAEKQNKQPLDKTTKIANNPPKPSEKEKLKNKLKSKGLTMGIEPTTKKEDEIIEKDLQEQKPNNISNIGKIEVLKNYRMEGTEKQNVIIVRNHYKNDIIHYEPNDINLDKTSKKTKYYCVLHNPFKQEREVKVIYGSTEDIIKNKSETQIKKWIPKKQVSEETRAKLKARKPTPKQIEARKKFAELMKKKKQEKQEREGKK